MTWVTLQTSREIFCSVYGSGQLTTWKKKKNHTIISHIVHIAHNNLLTCELNLKKQNLRILENYTGEYLSLCIKKPSDKKQWIKLKKKL